MLKTTFPRIQQESSILGFGCMRFPTVDGHIDEEKAIAMLRHAIDNGVTYIDTAYPYHNGESEIVVGKALRDGYREKVQLATKLPLWNLKTHEDMMNLLDEQLAKLQTDHIDFYLLHGLNRDRLELVRSLDYKRFLAEAVAQGKIRYPSFSFHDNRDAFMEILNDYDWKMCQVQMNILDDQSQATLEGIREAGRRGIGVVIMEPLRGGLLANPPQRVLELYQGRKEQRSPVEWAFRYLYTMPEVITILSGMSTMEQVQDNLRIFDLPERPTLSQEEKDLFALVKKTYIDGTKTRCTGCRYCHPCPMGVAIHHIFQRYDQSLLRMNGSFREGYKQVVADGKDASKCVECRRCESLCPQHLPIVQYLKEIHAELTAE